MIGTVPLAVIYYVIITNDWNTGMQFKDVTSVMKFVKNTNNLYHKNMTSPSPVKDTNKSYHENMTGCTGKRC